MQEVKSVTLRSGATIGEGHPCFVVAEIGNNHQGDPEIAARMVREAANAGAQAVKFQKRKTEALLTREGRAAPYTGCNSFGPTYGEHRDALELSIEQMAELKTLAESLGLVFFASAWDDPSLDEVLSLDVELLKISSAELVNLPLVAKYAAAQIPIILSTGMSSLEDIEAAVGVIRTYHDDLMLLHCNSTYPCPEECIGLPVMETCGNGSLFLSGIRATSEGSGRALPQPRWVPALLSATSPSTRPSRARTIRSRLNLSSLHRS